MPDNNKNIEKILETGFSQLPVDELTITRAVKAISQRSKKMQNENNLHLWEASKLLYALAASLVLICSFTYIHLYKKTIRLKSEAKVQNSKHPKLPVSVLSYIGNTKKFSSDNAIKTDEQSQMLVSLGNRTKVILFENSSFEILRSDSLHSNITLLNGSIAVDVTPGGFDTITVKTMHGTFTQIGTRFSVFVDSLKGSKLEVYRGKVRVTDSCGTNLPVLHDQEWKSSQKLKASPVNRRTSEIDEIHQVFTNNKLPKRLLWNTDFSEKEQFKSDLYKKGNKSDKKVICTKSIVETVKELVDKDNYKEINSIIAQIRNPFVADTIYETLQSSIRRNASLFKFPKAIRLLDCIVVGKAFKMQKRENAWLQGYLICKENIKVSSNEKLKLIDRYKTLFPQGTIGDDVLAESIQLKLSLQRYSEAVFEMEKFFTLYPQSIHCKDYYYIYASTLRNHLNRQKPSLDAYKKYVSRYPNEKYEEDALYWIIELSYRTGDMDSFDSYKKIYLERYHNGRWSETVQAINSGKKHN